MALQALAPPLVWRLLLSWAPPRSRAAFEGSIVPSHEIADYRWLAPRDLHRLATTPNLDEVLKRAFTR